MTHIIQTTPSVASYTSTTTTITTSASGPSPSLSTIAGTSSSSSSSNGGAGNTSTSSTGNCSHLANPLANNETCLICGDVASGKHYGLKSCEACKAFFKRTVQGKIEYSCPATRECEINKRRRKACQACRFQKCLNMGMLKEGVRLDRVRGGRQKYRRGLSPAPASTSGSSHCMNTSVVVKSEHSSSSSTKTTPTPASTTTTTTTPLGANSVIVALVNCEPEELSVSSAAQYSIPSNLSIQLKTLHILSDLFDRELVSLIGWAKQIPGFTETITLNDQMRLLQSTWAEVIAISIGYRSHLNRIEYYKQQQHHQGNGNHHHHFMNTTIPSPTSSSPASTTSSSYNNASNNSSGGPTSYNLENIEIRLVFAKDLIIDFKHALTCGADEIFYNCVQLIKRLDYLNITPKEYMLLKAISLTNADVRLENPKAASRLRDMVMDALYEATLAECLGGTDNLPAGGAFKSAASGPAGGDSPQVKIDAQERPPSSMNQHTSSSSSQTPPPRLSSSVPSSSSTSSISPDAGNNNSNSNNLVVNNVNLDLSKKTLINNRMNQVLLCLPVLRQIDTSIRKFWNDIRRGPNNVPMNKLFEEMLDPVQRMYRSSIEM